MRNRAGFFGPKDGNCFLYGCGAAVLLGLGGLIIAGVMMKQMFDQVKEEFTSAEAVELPSVEANDATIQRVDEWKAALENGEAAEPLKLTQDDVNVVIQHHPDFEALADTVYVSIEGSNVKGDMSIPLDFFPGLGGRYFNGSATFEMSLENERLYLYVVGASVNGEAVPESGLDGLRNTNIAEDANRDPELQKALKNVESISVADGVLTIVPKGGAAEEPAEEAEAEDEAA